MGEPDSLFVSRGLLQLDHSKLRSHMDDFNYHLSDCTLQWRHLGEAGVMLIQSGEYAALTQVPRARLRTRPARQVAKELNVGFSNDFGKREVPLKTATFLGHNTADYVHIGFSIDPEMLQDERAEIETRLDGMNVAPGYWRHDFNPYISLATLNRLTADEQVLSAFQGIMPESVILHKPQARLG